MLFLGHVCCPYYHRRSNQGGQSPPLLFQRGLSPSPFEDRYTLIEQSSAENKIAPIFYLRRLIFQKFPVGAFPQAPRKHMFHILSKLYTLYKLYQPVTTLLSPLNYIFYSYASAYYEPLLWFLLRQVEILLKSVPEDHLWSYTNCLFANDAALICSREDMLEYLRKSLQSLV